MYIMYVFNLKIRNIFFASHNKLYNFMYIYIQQLLILYIRVLFTYNYNLYIKKYNFFKTKLY